MDRFQFRVLIVLCLLFAFLIGCTREERIDSSQANHTAQEEAIESNQNEPAADSGYTHSFSNWVEISAPGWGIEGAEERVCAYCGERQIQTIPQYTYGLEISQDGVVVSIGSITEDIIIIIPSTISPTDSTPVTAIGDHAFQNDRFGRYGHSEGLTRIRIPNSVIAIGEGAFAFNRLAAVTIPDSVTSIGAFAFENNHQLASVIIPDSVTSIGVAAFRLGDLTSITIPDSITVIEQAAFSNNRLANVVIPDSVTVIEHAAFTGNQLTSVTFGNNVTIIGTTAFQSNPLTSIVIPDSVTTIGGGAFWGSQPTSVTIGNGVTTIGNTAFGTRYLQHSYSRECYHYWGSLVCRHAAYQHNHASQCGHRGFSYRAGRTRGSFPHFLQQ